MFRLWAREFKQNHTCKEIVIEDSTEDTRTHKIFNALDKVCLEFDLSRPIWLDINVTDFKRNSKTRFTKDNFVEELSFDYLEIQVIEEDY